MGATVYAGGTEFRVRAPNASAVSVAGEFAGRPIGMTREAGGMFAVRATSVFPSAEPGASASTATAARIRSISGARLRQT